jgi:hypothetical protein
VAGNENSYRRREDAIYFTVTEVQTHDSKVTGEMMNFLNLDEIRRFIANKAYDKIRALKENNIQAEIPNKRNRETPFISFSLRIHRSHNGKF